MYKNHFNTRSKIMSEPGAFIQATEKTIKILEDRMEKEDEKLYPVI